MDIGKLVRVTDHDSIFYRGEGTVVGSDADDHGTVIRVQFGVEQEVRFDSLAFRGAGESDPDNIEAFSESQLEEIDVFSTEVLAVRMFGRHMYHSIAEYEFEEGVDPCCMIADCKSQPTDLAYVNFVGTILRLHTCNACHEKLNGLCTECLDLG